jgi:acyl CoA:acetate/3-ketoacid CoA transferase beta subunit
MAEVRATEIMAAAAARELRDGEVAIVGIGLPLVACFLARRTHAPGLTALSEIGVVNMDSLDTPVGVADPRNFYRATCWSSFLDVMGFNLHRGVVDVGVIGALETDRFGNVNTTLYRDPEGTIHYFNGSAGGNDTASCAKRTVIIMRHGKRKLPKTLAHLTSPGFVGGRSRQESGLRGGGPVRLITDKAVIGFDAKTHAATLVSLHPGISLRHIIENTVFELKIPAEIAVTALPTDEDLRVLREEIDPGGMYLR